MWNWVDTDGSPGQLAVSLWLDSREGYPAVGVPHDTRFHGRDDCRIDVRNCTLSIVEFCLEFSNAPNRRFIAASLTLGDGTYLKAIAHAALQEAIREFTAILTSVRRAETAN